MESRLVGALDLLDVNNWWLSDRRIDLSGIFVLDVCSLVDIIEELWFGTSGVRSLGLLSRDLVGFWHFKRLWVAQLNILGNGSFIKFPNAHDRSGHSVVIPDRMCADLWLRSSFDWGSDSKCIGYKIGVLHIWMFF